MPPVSFDLLPPSPSPRGRHVADILNASVYPEGVVSVFTGILAAAETDDEIAAVLSHEVAHVPAQHAMANQSGGLIAFLATLPAVPFAVAGTVIGELWVIAAPPLILGGLILLAVERKREA